MFKFISLINFCFLLQFFLSLSSTNFVVVANETKVYLALDISNIPHTDHNTKFYAQVYGPGGSNKDQSKKLTPELLMWRVGSTNVYAAITLSRDVYNAFEQVSDADEGFHLYKIVFKADTKTIGTKTLLPADFEQQEKNTRQLRFGYNKSTGFLYGKH